MFVNINRFDKSFRKHPDFKLIVDGINRSPHLVDLINRLPASEKIKLGEPGSGCFFSPRKQKISIDENWVNEISRSSDPAYPGTFTTMLAHEISHAVVPDGLAETSKWMALPDYIDAKLKEEGIAVLAEYRVAKELNAPMWSDVYGQNSLQKHLDSALARHGGNTSSSQFSSVAIMVGAQAYSPKNPSGAPHLTYEQYSAAWYVLEYGQHDYTDEQIKHIGWKQVKPADIELKPEVVGQRREFDHLLPLTFSPVSPAAFASQSQPGEKSAQLYDILTQVLLQHGVPETDADFSQGPIAGMTLISYDSLRKDRIERARQAYEHAQDAFWTSGDVFSDLRTDIEQHALANCVDPDDLLASVFTDNPPLDFVQRVTAAIAVSPGAQMLEEDVRLAQRHFEQQLHLSPLGSILEINRDKCSLSLL